jgi:hypothetical protein
MLTGEPPGSSRRMRLRASTPSQRSGASSARQASPARQVQTPRLQTPTKADAERAKVESDRRAAAQAAKNERLMREKELEMRQLERSRSAHHSASTLRANMSAAMLAQRTQLRSQRLDNTAEVKRMQEALKKERDEQRAKWRARGKQLNNLCIQSRNAAAKAHDRVREHNLLEAHRSTAERLDLFRQSAEAQSALNDAKRIMAERVRREAGLNVVRRALTMASAERMDTASNIRERSEHDTLEAEAARLRQLEAHKLAACRVELEASPERVRELKHVESARKAGLTGGLRRQYRAFEVSPPLCPAPLTFHHGTLKEMRRAPRLPALTVFLPASLSVCLLRAPGIGIGATHRGD